MLLRDIDSISYLEVSEVFNVIIVLNILLIAEVPQCIHITICSFISCENVVIGYDNYLFTIPDLRYEENKQSPALLEP